MKLFSTDIRSTYVTAEEFKRLDGTFLGKCNLFKSKVLCWMMGDSLSEMLCELIYRTTKYAIFIIGVITCLKYIL
jgi:hypothetical protein